MLKNSDNILKEIVDLGHIFNAKTYKERYDLGYDEDALEHYLSVGYKLGYEPNFLFCTPYYSKLTGYNIDLNISPLEHFIANNNSNISPHPLFDYQFYKSNNKIEAENLFHAYVDFLNTKTKNNIVTTPLFDVVWYVSSYVFVQNEKCSAFEHYMLYGHKSDLKPNALFDISWYKSIYGPPITEGLDSLSEFVWFGHNELKMPNPLFDTYFYLNQYPDVQAKNQNSLVDYIYFGAKNGRFPNPLFDSKYYLYKNASVVENKYNPLAHYINEGARLRLNPSALFNSNFYLAQILNGKNIVNPLEHYIWIGAAKGYNCTPGFDASKLKSIGIETLHSNPAISLLFNKVNIYKDDLLNNDKNFDVIIGKSNNNSKPEHQKPVPFGSLLKTSDVEKVNGEVIFHYKLLDASGFYHDGWSFQNCKLRYITSDSAKLSFAVWTPFDKQSIEVLVHGKQVINSQLEVSEKTTIVIDLPFNGEVIDVDIKFANAHKLSGGDERKGAAIISEIKVSHDSFGKKSDKISGKSTIRDNEIYTNLKLIGITDFIWATKFARINGLRYLKTKLSEIKILRQQGFDESYYLSQDPYRFGKKIDPVLHYIFFGTDFGLDPNRDFSTEYYLSANSDVKNAKLNPLAHYLKNGLLEKRRVEPSTQKKNL